MRFSYLDFLDNPTPENVKLVHKKTGLIQLEASKIAGINLQTYRGWHSNPEKDGYRKPHPTTWNLFLYELEARRLGFACLKNFFEKANIKQCS